MRTFPCACGNTVYFDNTSCLRCGSTLGFDPGQLKIISVTERQDGEWSAASEPQRRFHKCDNYRTAEVCNWLVPVEDDDEFCIACRLNVVIPNLSMADNRRRWYKLEKAKRRLLYTLLSLQLPIIGYKTDSDRGLAFRFMEDVMELDPITEEVVTYEQIMTGHEAGTVTINIIEADDSTREKIRENMNESYRTILGHFRHEIAHYYWDQLVARTACLEPFRLLFGDERKDYKSSITRYYQTGPRPHWNDQFISAYASAHPWEDWAETWAHYLHFIDVLETAGFHQIGIYDRDISSGDYSIRSWLEQREFPVIVARLEKLMHALNELNRSLGLPDPYPFEHSPKVIEKLAFIHDIVMNT